MALMRVPTNLGLTAPCRTSDVEMPSLLGLDQSAMNGNYEGANAFEFYLYDTGAFDMSRVVTCFWDAIGAKPGVDDLDEHLMPNVSEHLTDFWLLKHLKDHPARTLDRNRASLHIVGAPILTSFAAASLPGSPCGDMAGHRDRTAAVAQALRDNKQYQQSEGSNFLFINTGPFICSTFGPDIMALIRESTPILATADKEYSNIARIPELQENSILIPYKAHYVVENDVWQSVQRNSIPSAPYAPSHKKRPLREVSFMFHGRLERGNGGAARSAILELGDRLQGSSMRDVSFSDFTPDEFKALSRETAGTYLNSSFCLIPVGDTPTSRRLFDALAAGCVPVVLNDMEAIVANLPFKASIDWGRIAIFAGSLGCVSEKVDETARWLDGLRKEDGLSTNRVRHMRDLGRFAFRHALSYRSPGIADALLRELKLRDVFKRT